MLLVLFWVIILFINSKLILCRFKLSWIDWVLILVTTAIVQWGTPIIGAWTNLPEFLLVSVSVYMATKDWRTALVVTVESELALSIVTLLTLLIEMHWHYSSAIPVTFFLLSLVGVGILYGLTQRVATPIHRLNNVSVGLICLAFLLAMSYLQLIAGQQQTKENWLGLGLVGTLLLIMVALQSLSSRNIKQASQLKQQQAILTSNLHYTQAMEQHYDELRRFRHDYQNVMLSLDEYLKTDDLVGLKHYYQTTLMPKNQQLAASKYQLEDIAHIQDKAIKSILFNKLSYAQNEAIKVTLEVPTVITAFKMPTVDLVVALGIILDNAIEATDQQADAWLHVAIMTTPNSQVILVKNPVTTILPPLWQLETDGFSTKGDHRGLGLSNLQRLVDESPQVSLATEITTTVFSQTVTIRLGEAHD
ncbi:sensor histidine kinase [Lactiplantibacillus daowaiensis]|uniref:Sensor histidine kinase n=1 Tax=Lactiplantibacillus daowaiensis TaxID=2559918 RepID=A0ABW1RZA8_9LACO|nr:GHKL domain-containing protein [Lactiplantibacillus daowaiensis]